MIQFAIPLIAVLLPMLLAAAFLLGRHWHRRQPLLHQLSAVTRQHIELFQGGQLSEVAVETAKARFRDLFSRGEVAAVEESLRAGTHFVIHVRALAEIGTDDAGRILERQLQRRLTSDAIEQSWYWIDLANGLRNLNREQSLPHLLRCAEANGDHPLSHFFAAETVCFLSFAGYLRQPHTPLGRAALRVLHRTLEGLRCGLQPQVVIEARLGELIEDLWDHRPRRISPLIVHVFAEALRLERRAPHAELILSDERYEQEAYGWQVYRLGVLEEALRDYLSEAPTQLGAQLASAAPEEQSDILRALEDIHGEAAWAILPLLARSKAPHAEQAVNALAWSRDESVGPWLRAWVYRNVPVARRMRSRRLAMPPKTSSVGSDIPYVAVLRALRNFASSETETLLLQAARDWDPSYRTAAVGSLGWCEPFARRKVQDCLRQARRDVNHEVRASARAALARLGELQALQWYRLAITSQEPQRVHEAIQMVAQEQIVLLWPDLDRLAESENVDVALHACEALERLRENLLRQPF
jgi:hypothetical protein